MSGNSGQNAPIHHPTADQLWDEHGWALTARQGAMVFAAIALGSMLAGWIG